MRLACIILVVFISISACNRNGRIKHLYENEQKEFVQQQSLPGGDELKIQYMPTEFTSKKNTGKTENTLQFHADLVMKNGTDFLNKSGYGFYQADSLFCMIHDADTTWPVYVLPVASGLKNKREYIVTFAQPETTESDELLIVAKGLKQQYGNIEPFLFKLSKINKLEKLN